jgi:hypothetical protein
VANEPSIPGQYTSIRSAGRYRRLATAAFLVGLLPIGAALANPAPLCPPALVLDIERDALSLGGVWERLREQAAAEAWRPEVAAQLGPWEAVEIPGRIVPGQSRVENEKLRNVWMRRRFELDTTRGTRDAVLRWGGIRYGATAYVNGQEIGHHAPIGPHAIALPRGLLRAGANEILLKIPGWAALEKSEAGVPTIPVGADLFWGPQAATIFDDIWIEFYDGLYFRWILAVPDPEGGRVRFRVVIDGLGDGRPPGARARVRVWPKTGHENGQPTAAPAGVGEIDIGVTTGPIEIVVPMRGARRWSPQAPNLYLAEIEATAGGHTLDRARFHFGMRALGVERGHFLMNKRPLWLRGSNLVYEWSWGGEFRDAKRYIVDEARRMNLNSFRTHTLPPPTHWANVADAHGMMLLAEFPVTYNYLDFEFTPEQRQQFRRNVLADATGWITKLWNHPSIVAWVISNEPVGDTDWEVGPYQQLVRALDPTRLIVRTGDDLGTDDLVAIHPTLNYTNAHDGELALTARRAAANKDPRRALGSTEYMNYLGPRAEIVTRRLGRSDHPGAALEFAEVAAEDTEVMRRLGFDVILPYMYAGWTRFRGNNWRPEFATPMAAALHSAMAPVLASWELFDRNFVAGRRVRTDLVFMNETDTATPVRVDVYVTAKHPLFVPEEAALPRTAFRRRIRRTLPAQSRRTMAVEWPVPARPGTYYLAAVLRRPGHRPVVSQRVVHAVTPPELPLTRRPTDVVLLGADRALERWFDRKRIAHRDPGVSDLVAASRIVVGGRVVSASGDDGVTQALLDAVARGARLVILDPRHWSWPRLVDFSIRPGLATSRVFAYGSAGQDLLSGIPLDFFTRWNGLPGTLAYGFVSSGAPDLEPVMWGNNQNEPVLVRRRHGQGEIVVVLLRLVDRLDPASESYDPVAESLLINLIQR